MTEDVTRRTTVGLAIGAVTLASAQAADLGSTRERAMEHVVGVGGFFFRAKEPKALAKWYADNLGIAPVSGSYGGPVWDTEAGTTVFAPFPADSKMFGRPEQQWIINFRVRDLDAMTAQLRANGVAVEVDPQTYPNGRFASLADPEGNPIQLWEPEDAKKG